MDEDIYSERISYLIDIDNTITIDSNKYYIVKDGKPDWEYFYDNVSKMKPNKERIKELIKARDNYKDSGNLDKYSLIFSTARNEISRKKTEAWIEEHIGFSENDYELLMRKEKCRKDSFLVKIENFYKHNHISRKLIDNVALFAEDDMRVCYFYKTRGLTPWRFCPSIEAISKAIKKSWEK